MRIALAATARMPTEWAHGLQIARMAEAFAALGHEVELWLPDRPGTLPGTVEELYALRAPLALRRVPDGGLPWLSPGQRLAFSLAALALLARRRPDLLLSREEILAALAARLGPSLFELHTFPRRRLRVVAALARASTGVVSTNEAKRRRLVEEHGLDPARIVVLPNGTDIERIDAAPALDLRQHLGLPAGCRILLYAGHLHRWKGVEHLVGAAAWLPDDVHIVILGGRDEDLARCRPRWQGPRVHLPGRVPPAEVAAWLKGADVLVLPNVEGDPESREQTSPLKLAEYMAAGRPILASDLPSLREQLDEGCALLVPPERPLALARGAMALLQDPAGARARAEEARRRVEGRSWRARAEGVLAFAAALGSRAGS